MYVLFHLQEDHMCTYSYAAMQELFQGEMQQNVSITATVEVSCDSGKCSDYFGSRF